VKSFISFSAVETALETQTLSEILRLGIQLTNEIVAEILCSHAELLEEVGLHDQSHKAVLVKKIVFSFITIKGKHICRTTNIEENTLIRHQNTKTVLFRHE
jgi:hypothetical protein